MGLRDANWALCSAAEDTVATKGGLRIHFADHAIFLRVNDGAMDHNFPFFRGRLGSSPKVEAFF